MVAFALLSTVCVSAAAAKTPLPVYKLSVRMHYSAVEKVDLVATPTPDGATGPPITGMARADVSAAATSVSILSDPDSGELDPAGSHDPGYVTQHLAFKGKISGNWSGVIYDPAPRSFACTYQYGSHPPGTRALFTMSRPGQPPGPHRQPIAWATGLTVGGIRPGAAGAVTCEWSDDHSPMTPPELITSEAYFGGFIDIPVGRLVHAVKHARSATRTFDFKTTTGNPIWGPPQFDGTTDDGSVQTDAIATVTITKTGRGHGYQLTGCRFGLVHCVPY